MKRVFVVEEILRAEHKVIIETDEDYPLEVSEENDDIDGDIEFMINQSVDLDDCNGKLLLVNGVVDVNIEEGTFITSHYGFLREE